MDCTVEQDQAVGDRRDHRVRRRWPFRSLARSCGPRHRLPAPPRSQTATGKLRPKQDEEPVKDQQERPGNPRSAIGGVEENDTDSEHVKRGDRQRPYGGVCPGWGRSELSQWSLQHPPGNKHLASSPESHRSEDVPAEQGPAQDVPEHCERLPSVCASRPPHRVDGYPGKKGSTREGLHLLGNGHMHDRDEAEAGDISAWSLQRWRQPTPNA